jgi:hypothetical protein
VARAQQGSGMRRISHLAGGLNPGDPDTQANITAFHRGLIPPKDLPSPS